MHTTVDIGLITTMCLLHFLALITPGPDFFLTLRNSLSFGRQIGVATAFGFGAGIFLHLSYCIAGVAVILVKMSWFPYMKFIAATYLIWMGISSLLALKKHTPVSSKVNTETGPKSMFRGFLDGLVTNLFNPKAVFFLMGLFTTVVTPQSDRFSIYLAGVGIVALTIIWFILVAIVFGNINIRKFYFKAERAMTALFALFFIVAGFLFCLN
jgi:threonine/homoserine/homoserine lactone efflux protein